MGVNDFLLSFRNERQFQTVRSFDIRDKALRYNDSHREDLDYQGSGGTGAWE